MNGFKMTALVLVVAGFCSVAWAQQDAGFKEKRLDKMQEKLSLTADQRTQVEAIFTASHEQMKKLHEQTDAQIKAVLNDEQKQKFDAWRQQMKDNWKKDGRHHGKKGKGKGECAFKE